MDIVAHRGASADAPENTLSAFRLAWEQGADGVECDVFLSLDGRIMVHHDPNVLHSTGVDLTIAATDSADLRRLEVGASGDRGGEPIPYLEEVFATVPPGGRILVDVKCGPEIVPALQAACDRLPPQARPGLISPRPEVLAACREGLPGWYRYLLVTTGEPDGRGVYPAHAPNLIRLAQDQALAGLVAEFRGIGPAFARAVREAGLALIPWSITDPAEALRLRTLGAEAIITPLPQEMLRVLSSA